MMLKHGSPDDVRNMFVRLRNESRDLLKSVISLVYFMRGSIQYDDMMLMTPVERELVNEFLKDRFEQEKDRHYPVY